MNTFWNETDFYSMASFVQLLRMTCNSISSSQYHAIALQSQSTRNNENEVDKRINALKKIKLN